MIDQTVPPAALPAPPARPRRHRWLRWLTVGIVALIVLIYGAVAAYVKLTPVPAALTLPPTAAAPSGSLPGAWTVTTGSTAGFRIRQTVLGLSNESVGRTTAITGDVAIDGGQVTAATFHVDLTAVTVGGRPSPQLAESLATAAYPAATITLVGAIGLPDAFVTGAAFTGQVPVQFTLRGTDRPVTATITARRDGALVRIAGTIPVDFSLWGIPDPQGFGPLGSLADHGTAEFLLVLRHG